MLGKPTLAGSSYFVNDVHDQAGHPYEERHPGDYLRSLSPVTLVNLLLIYLLGFVDKLLVLKTADTFFLITFQRWFPLGRPAYQFR